jgi:hypothetical protein
VRNFLAIILFIASLSCNSTFAQTVPVGALAHDGPATPEQLALRIPVTGALPNTATATVRYRLSSSATWIEGHPLFRVRPNFSTNPAVGSVTDDFAWTILDLEPGRSYEVEVTVTNGGSSELRTGTFTTRALPPAAGAPNKTIAAGASNAEIQAVLNNMQPGDVIQFEDGQYSINQLQLNRSGALNNPIYIRGASRANVVLSSSARIIFTVSEASNVIIENLTIQGTGADGAIGSLQRAISSYGIATNAGPSRFTVRNVTIAGVDSGISFYDEASQTLVYDNTVAGNNRWNAAFLGDNRTWDDDGINLPGFGNVGFNNTISGFGDTLSYSQHAGNGTLTESRGIHYYRNDIRNSLDDVVEVDHAHRNATFYDNRAHNVATCTSLDPLYGGPFIYARNVCINPARVNLHKWNDTNTGQFIYNNTFIIGTTAAGGDPDVSAWYQPNNGDQQAYGFRNNLTVYRGGGNTLWLESGGHSVVDWTHNSWFPNRQIQWDFSAFNNLADAQSSLRDSTPIFSGTSRRMENDNITVSNPWTTTVTLGPNALTEITASYAPVLAAGTSPKNSGTPIANITSGFSGAAPDRGGLISGRAIPNWGDQNSTPLPPPITPNPPANLVIN